MTSGSKQSGKKTKYAQIDIQFFPVQRVSAAQNFDLGQIIIGRSFKAFAHARREREPASIGQLRDNPAAGGVKAHCLDARFIDKRLPAMPFRKNHESKTKRPVNRDH